MSAPEGSTDLGSGVVLLTGGTGFVGSHLREALRTFPVCLLGRNEPILSTNERWSYLDLSETIASEKLAGGEILCHLAYSTWAGRLNVAYNQHLVEAVNASPSVRRVILMSSVSVYGKNYSQVIDEESPCYPDSEYSETKLACEMIWHQGLREDCELIVLRPSEIIGIGGRGMLTLIRDALERPLVGALKRSLLHHRPLHYVAVSNVTAAVIYCIERLQPSAREVFIISDDHGAENKSYAVMQDFVRKASGRQALPNLEMPRLLVRAFGKVTGKPLSEERIFDAQKIYAAGFENTIPLSEEVTRLAREYTTV